MEQVSKYHARLIEKQPTSELQRKADKAHSRQNIWTQEDLDLAHRKAEELSKALREEP